jgi:beta-lactam-binding protein with PASTA domain
MDEWQGPVIGQNIMPDFVGHRALDVIRNLVNQGINYQVHGGGTVITSHFPAPGFSMPNPHGIPVHLHTDPATRIAGGMTFMPNVVGLNASQALEFVRDAVLVPAWFGGEGELGGYDVYQQFPVAGTELEQGVSVMLRVKGRE